MIDVNELTAYIQQAARARGIDPTTALRVARSEGLRNGVWQSNVKKGDLREPSYGPFQLLVGGEGTGFPTGMGNDFERATGLKASDPANVRAGIDFALDQAVKGGWSPWYGAKSIGITGKEGIGAGAKPMGINSVPGSPIGPGLAFPPRPALGETPLAVELSNAGAQFGPTLGKTFAEGMGSGVAEGMGHGFGMLPPVSPMMNFVGALGKMGGAMAGRGNSGGGSAPLTTSIGMEDGGRYAAAAQLMAQLVANKKMPGLTMGG